MKTMNDYAIYCTEDQTIRAYRLGAPIENKPNIGVSCSIPTTQQMINWLIEQGFLFAISMESKDTKYTVAYQRKEGRYGIAYKTSELAAIDAALNYLEKGETK